MHKFVSAFFYALLYCLVVKENIVPKYSLPKLDKENADYSAITHKKDRNIQAMMKCCWLTI